ncbi:MAG TPA: hypothetical protein VLG46_09490 [Anaerolineae bacterium]|nr:hypothetical protein [Anaerolineae bacterium]
MQQPISIESKCHTCALRARAAENPKALTARLWRWHTKWCPGWKAYLKELDSKGLKRPQI